MMEVAHSRNNVFCDGGSDIIRDNFILQASGLSRKFGDYVALEDVNLDIHEGEFVALLGPSGCGKTTLLKIIAGLVAPSQGNLTISSRDMVRVPAHRRPVNTVFQNYALFPHLSVFDNVAFGLRRARRPKGEISNEVISSLKSVSMEDFSDRYPIQLSGGQQQRVALARAIVNKPAVLLLDEPLSALDLQLRKRMQIELKELQQKLSMTFVFVTHDQDEALTIADRIVVMNRGRIEQIGTGEEIYNRPNTRFVAGFIGEANFIPLSIETIQGISPDMSGELMVRPEHVSLSMSDGDAPGYQSIRAEVRQIIFKGPFISILCMTEKGTEVIALDTVGANYTPVGTKIRLSWRVDAAHMIGN